MGAGVLLPKAMGYCPPDFEDRPAVLLEEEHPDGFEPNMDLSDVSSEILAITLCEW